MARTIFDDPASEREQLRLLLERQEERKKERSRREKEEFDMRLTALRENALGGDMGAVAQLWALALELGGEEGTRRFSLDLMRSSGIGDEAVRAALAERARATN